jgi:hypothetical protein
MKGKFRLPSLNDVRNQLGENPSMEDLGRVLYEHLYGEDQEERGSRRGTITTPDGVFQTANASRNRGKGNGKKRGKGRGSRPATPQPHPTQRPAGGRNHTPVKLNPEFKEEENSGFSVWILAKLGSVSYGVINVTAALAVISLLAFTVFVDTAPSAYTVGDILKNMSFSVAVGIITSLSFSGVQFLFTYYWKTGLELLKSTFKWWHVLIFGFCWLSDTSGDFIGISCIISGSMTPANFDFTILTSVEKGVAVIMTVFSAISEFFPIATYLLLGNYTRTMKEQKENKKKENRR